MPFAGTSGAVFFTERLSSGSPVGDKEVDTIATCTDMILASVCMIAIVVPFVVVAVMLLKNGVIYKCLLLNSECGKMILLSMP